jgi:peptidoglycan/LPS O-acetylase OafA/YrhL
MRQIPPRGDDLEDRQRAGRKKASEQAGDRRFPCLPRGSLGVEVFFVISGHLIGGRRR